jgi:hypothetical protein
MRLQPCGESLPRDRSGIFCRLLPRVREVLGLTARGEAMPARYEFNAWSDADPVARFPAR